MVEFTVSAESSASVQDVLDAARDFTPRRIEIWPNVSARRYAVHAEGETFAEVTEGALQGLFWERSRYEWDRPGTVRQTVTESNVLAAGSTWELTVAPLDGGCLVETTFRREFRHTPKGAVAWLINRFASGVYGSDLRRALRAIEAGSSSKG